jgi:protein-tyrosine-phosphatase
LVCTGNMCRSPMAEVMLKDLLRRDGKESLHRVRSAGTWTTNSRPASSLAMEAVQELGLDLSAHHTHLLSSDDVGEASVILVMARDHKEALVAEFPEASQKTFLLSELVGERYDIFDPYGSESLGLYRDCAREIGDLLRRGYDRILELAGEDDEGPRTASLAEGATDDST